MHIHYDGQNLSRELEEMTMNEPSITVLSSFDWSVPGTPELICEKAHPMQGLPTIIFQNQPQFSNKSQQIGHAPKIPLYEIDSCFRIKVSPIKNTLQNSRITCSSSNKEIMLSKSFGEFHSVLYEFGVHWRHSPKTENVLWQTCVSLC